MQTFAVLALILGLGMLFRWLGPPVRRRPEEKQSTKSKSRDFEVPTFIFYETRSLTASASQQTQEWLTALMRLLRSQACRS